MKRNIIRVLLVLILICIIGFYVFDLIVNHTEPTKYLFRTVSIACICIASLIRTFGRNRRSLKYYEAQYPEILTNAFADQAFWRQKLLCAVRLYNEDALDKAIKYLTDLKEKCRYKEDYYAVYLFAALCFTDMELYSHAQSVYQSLINADIANSTVFSNLGHVQIKMGEYKKALQNYNHALEYDRDNEYAYNNIAQAHFQMYEFDETIPYALKALEINPKMDKASTLLAITYALTGDRKNAEKYFHIAISSGRDPKEIKDAIEYYRTAQHAMDDIDDADDEDDENAD